jgi:hypothetical protein
VELLSEEWLAAVKSALAGASVDPEARIVVEQVVTDSPRGTLRYRVRVAEGRMTLEVGDGESADVTITTTWSLAREIAAGRASAQDAFLHGHLRLAGDVNSLLSHRGLASVLAEAFGSPPPQTLR